MITVPSMVKVDVTGSTMGRTLLWVRSHGPESLEGTWCMEMSWVAFASSSAEEFQMGENSASGMHFSGTALLDLIYERSWDFFPCRGWGATVLPGQLYDCCTATTIVRFLNFSYSSQRRLKPIINHFPSTRP